MMLKLWVNGCMYSTLSFFSFHWGMSYAFYQVTGSPAGRLDCMEDIPGGYIPYMGVQWDHSGWRS
jgi:hypothetical protein